MKYNSMQLTLLISFFLSIFYFQISTAQECKYGEYYHLIGLAKKSNSKKNYKDAKKYFQLGFSKTDFPLGHDLSFALYAANEEKDDLWARSIAEKLAKGGIPLRYFFRFKKKKWYTKFESEFKNYSKYYDENFNKELRQELILLLNKDRDYTNKYHKWRTREIEISINELIAESSERFSDFEQIVSKYGFPNEKLMGYNYVRRKNMVEPYKTDVLMVHIYQFGVLFLNNAISTIVCEGGLPPDFEKLIKKIRGFGNSTGIEQEMKARYKKFRGTE